MTVELQSYIQPVASRIPVPTRITNVMATLHGSTSPNRIHVISGHYDSRVTDVMNATADAPGRRGRANVGDAVSTTTRPGCGYESSTGAIFGVRAVSQSGYRSPVTFPGPL